MSNPSMADLAIYYTGGGSNAVTTLSIGGAISSAPVPLQTLTSTGTITGVTLNEGYGNTVGDGTLTYTASTNKFTWTPKSGASGTGVTVTADGKYFVQGASNGGGLSITVVFASLPTSTTSDTVTVANQTEKWFLNQTKAETLAGVTKYHYFAVKNTHATESLYDVRLYIAENTPGADTITLLLDPLVAGAGGTGPTALTNENTAPGSGTFVAPDSYTHADKLAVGTLAAGQCRFFCVKQLTPANITTGEDVNTFKLGMYCKG